MSRKHKRPRVEIARAVHRLMSEALKNLEELAGEAGVSADTLKRWGISGKQGVHLDLFHRPLVGWLSSTEAVQRFLREWSAKTGRTAAG
jgi:hypothetical protein